eukprot:jgi/Bigna1/80642/fgenesh1_pg.73_\
MGSLGFPGGETEKKKAGGSGPQSDVLLIPRSLQQLHGKDTAEAAPMEEKQEEAMAVAIDWKVGELCEVWYQKAWELATIVRINELKQKRKVPYYKLVGSIGTEMCGYKIRRPQGNHNSHQPTRKRNRKKHQVYNIQRDPKRERTSASTPTSTKPFILSNIEIPNILWLQQKHHLHHHHRHHQPAAGAAATVKKDTSSSQKKPKRRKSGGSSSSNSRRLSAEKKKNAAVGAANAMMKMDTGENNNAVSTTPANEEVKAVKAVKKKLSRTPKKPSEEQQREGEGDDDWGIRGETLTLWSEGMWFKHMLFNYEWEGRRAKYAARRAEKKEQQQKNKETANKQKSAATSPAAGKTLAPKVNS